MITNFIRRPSVTDTFNYVNEAKVNPKVIIEASLGSLRLVPRNRAATRTDRGLGSQSERTAVAETVV